MNILVLNCGSSSLKYRIIAMPEEKEIVSGEAQRVGIKSSETSIISHIACGQERSVKVEIKTHVEAFKKIVQLISEDKNNHQEVDFEIIAHRYINGGEFFLGTTRIFEDDLDKLRNTFNIAPLHTPIIFSLISYCSKEFNEFPQYIVTDNSFHQSIPLEYSTYALPIELMKKYKMRKMGYHGISHQFVMQESLKFLRREALGQKIISCHLGTGGSSICAIHNGKSVNSSMGFTPLEGLIMNTRSGDIDVAMIFRAMYQQKLSSKEAENYLNKKSGILSIFKESSDLRDALREHDNNPNAKLAYEMYVRRIKKYIGNFILQLQKIDILIFTDTLGIGLANLRNVVCEGFDFFGIQIDPDKNNNYKSGISDVSLTKSEVRILIIPTNEELMIARETFRKINLMVKQKK